MSKKSMSKQERVAVFWTCDKRNCEKHNYRNLIRGTTILSDFCDHCKLKIAEPLWEEFSPSNALSTTEETTD